MNILQRLITNIPFQFDQFESIEDCTCVNHEFILFGSGHKSFRVGKSYRADCGSTQYIVKYQGLRTDQNDGRAEARYEGR